MFCFDRSKKKTSKSKLVFHVRRRVLARRHKGGRPAGRRLKIASIGGMAAGVAPVRCALLYAQDSMTVKKDK